MQGVHSLVHHLRIQEHRVDPAHVLSVAARAPESSFWQDTSQRDPRLGEPHSECLDVSLARDRLHRSGIRYANLRLPGDDRSSYAQGEPQALCRRETATTNFPRCSPSRGRHLFIAAVSVSARGDAQCVWSHESSISSSYERKHGSARSHIFTSVTPSIQTYGRNKEIVVIQIDQSNEFRGALPRSSGTPNTDLRQSTHLNKSSHEKGATNDNQLILTISKTIL